MIVRPAAGCAPPVRINTDVSAGADARAGKYLAFHLNGEEFAIQVQKVREIMGVLGACPSILELCGSKRNRTGR